MRLGLLVSRTYTGFDRPCRRDELTVKDKQVDNCTDSDIKVKHIDYDDYNNDNNDHNGDNNSDDIDNDNNSANNDKNDSIDGDDHQKTTMKSKCCDFNMNNNNIQKNNTIKKENNQNNMNKQNVNHDMNDVTIKWLEDIYDNYTPLNPKKSNEKSFCLTDGCGFISLNLALKLPTCIKQGMRSDRKYDKSKIDIKNLSNISKTKNEIDNSNNKNDKETGDDKEEEVGCRNEQNSNLNLNFKNSVYVCVPSAFQVRIMSPFGVFKGTLVTHTTLPPNTIIVRDSMHKVQGPKIRKYDHQSTNIGKINGNRIKLSNVNIKKSRIPLRNKDGNIICHTRIDNKYDEVVFNNKNTDENEIEKENEIDDEKLLIEYEKIMEEYNKQQINKKLINNENSESREGTILNVDSPCTGSTMSTVSLQIVNTANPLKQYRCNLNKHLILLLHNLGVPFHIFEFKLR